MVRGDTCFAFPPKISYVKTTQHNRGAEPRHSMCKGTHEGFRYALPPQTTGNSGNDTRDATRIRRQGIVRILHRNRPTRRTKDARTADEALRRCTAPRFQPMPNRIKQDGIAPHSNMYRTLEGGADRGKIRGYEQIRTSADVFSILLGPSLGRNTDPMGTYVRRLAGLKYSPGSVLPRG